MISDDERREVARRLRGVPVLALAGLDDDGNRKEWEMIPLRELAGAIGSIYDGANDTEGHLEVVSRLADLIEPTDGFDLDHMAQVCFECLEGCDEPEHTLYEMILTAISRYKRGESGPPSSALVDRDALLDEVKELEKCAWYFGLDFDEDEPLRDRLKEASEDFAGSARRIRKALGVSGDA